MRRALLFSIGLAAASAAYAAESPLPAAQLGRLFYSPAERAQLDIARTLKKPAPATAAAAPAPVAEPASQVVTYGGIVRRSDGRSTLWINNRPVDEKEALSGAGLKGRVRADGAVSLQIPERAGTIDIKVGQSVELQSGRVAEGRKPAPEAKPAATPEAKIADDAKGLADAKGGAETKPAADAKAAAAPVAPTR